MPVISKKQSATKPVRKAKSVSVIDRIAPIGFDEDEGISILLYGRSGTGKTTLWSTFPKPILSIIRSGGKRPGETRSIITAANKKTIHTVAIENSQEVLELVEMQEKTNKYKTIVVDHLSGLQDLILAEILDLDHIPEQKAWGLAQQQDYGQCALQFKEIVRKVLDLSCNRVLIAQERDFSKGSDGPTTSGDMLFPFVAAALMPSIVGWLNPAVDYIGNTFIRKKRVLKTKKLGGKEKKVWVNTGEVEFCLRTAPDDVFATKFRVPKRDTPMPKEIVDPDHGKIMSIIQGG